jgi:hypothetical protein
MTKRTTMIIGMSLLSATRHFYLISRWQVKIPRLEESVDDHQCLFGRIRSGTKNTFLGRYTNYDCRNSLYETDTYFGKTTKIIGLLKCVWPIPVAARSKAWVCGRSLAGIGGFESCRGMDFCLLCVLCVVRYRSLLRADHSSRGVLPIVVCLSFIVNSWHWGGLGSLGAVEPR